MAGLGTAGAAASYVLWMCSIVSSVLHGQTTTWNQIWTNVLRFRVKNSYWIMTEAAETIQFNQFSSRLHQMEWWKAWICPVCRQWYVQCSAIETRYSEHIWSWYQMHLTAFGPMAIIQRSPVAQKQLQQPHAQNIVFQSLGTLHFWCCFALAGCSNINEELRVLCESLVFTSARVTAMELEPWRQTPRFVVNILPSSQSLSLFLLGYSFLPRTFQLWLHMAHDSAVHRWRTQQHVHTCRQCRPYTCTGCHRRLSS